MNIFRKMLLLAAVVALAGCVTAQEVRWRRIAAAMALSAVRDELGPDIAHALCGQVLVDPIRAGSGQRMGPGAAPAARRRAERCE